MGNTLEQTVEMCNEQCHQCNSEVQIPLEVKQKLTAVFEGNQSKLPQRLERFFRETEKYKGMPFFISPSTGSIYCSYKCYLLYTED